MVEDADGLLVEEFRVRGSIVVEGVLGPDAVEACRAGLHADLHALGVDHATIVKAAEDGAPLPDAIRVALQSVQSHTSGAFPLPFSQWRLEHCATNERLASLHQRLWQLYADGEDQNFQSPWAGTFDPTTENGTPILDGVGYRIPSSLVVAEDDSLLQAGIGMHFDLSPWAPWAAFDVRAPWRDVRASWGQKKTNEISWQIWRPIQCFIALTPGRFECCAGVHADWDELFATADDERSLLSGKKPFYGRHYSLHPWRKRYQERLKPYLTSLDFKAGDAVLWDARTPHRTSPTLEGARTREVVYSSFLPPTTDNKRYAYEQATCLRDGTFPPCQAFGVSPIVKSGGAVPGWRAGAEDSLSPFARSLLAPMPATTTSAGET